MRFGLNNGYYLSSRKGTAGGYVIPRETTKGYKLKGGDANVPVI